MKLTHKLTLAFVTVSLIAIGLVAVLIWGQFLYEFNRYLQDQRQNEFVAAATAYYEENQKWSGVDAYLRARGLLPPLSEVNPPLQRYVLVGPDRQVLVASPPYLVGEKVKKGEIDKGIPITDNGQVIGVVISTDQPLLRKPIEQK